MRGLKDLIFRLKTNDKTYVCRYSPVGWTDLNIEVERGIVNAGLATSYSVPIKFVKDGATYLRDVFYAKEQAQTIISIDKLDRVMMKYVNVYNGMLDFGTFTDDGISVSIAITDLNLSRMLAKYIDVANEVYLTCEESNNFKFYGPFDGLGNSFDRNCYYVKYSYFVEVVFKRMLINSEELTWEEILKIHFNSADSKYKIDVSLLKLHEFAFEYPALTTEYLLTMGGLDFKCTTSLQDVLKSIFVLFGLTTTIEIIGDTQILKFVGLDEAFPNNAFTHIENISDIKIHPSDRFMAKEINIGHVFNGLTSFWYKRILNNYTTPANISCTSIYRTGTIGSVLDLVNPFGIEHARILACYFYQDNVDAGYANHNLATIYLRHIDTYQHPLIDLGMYKDPDKKLNYFCYNVCMSPARLANKNAKFINSFKINNNALRFFENDCSANYGKAITYSYNTNIVQNSQQKDKFLKDEVLEGANISVNDRYFYPIEIEFEGILPISFLKNIYNMDSLHCSFIYNNNMFSGYITYLKMPLFGKEKATVKMLLSKNCNLSKLIY